MKYLFNHLQEVKEKNDRAKGYLLMLDFDGTLSPFAPTPEQAFLPNHIKREVQKCSRLFPTIIVSGRSLSDIKNKVGLKGLVYAGNHGLEWQIGKRASQITGAEEAKALLTTIKRKLKKILPDYPGALLEDKRLSIAIHYRGLIPEQVAKFKKDIIGTIKPLIGKKKLRISKGKKVLEVRSKINWDKGKFVLFIRRYFKNKLRKRLLSLYVGDDRTDEDAFQSLKSGITIRVGPSKASYAKYYIRNLGQVVLLMRWLREFAQNKAK